MPENANFHIGNRKQFKHYHSVVQHLVSKYAPSGGRVLDIGCGNGHLLALIRDTNIGYELTGADAFEDCLLATAERVPEARRVHVSDQSLETEKLGGPYDVVTMCHVLEHTLNPAETVRDALSLLSPTGHLILAVPNPVRPKMFFYTLLRRHYVNRGHVVAWDRSHWINFLDTILGLDVVEYSQDEVRVFPSRVAAFAPLRSVEVALSRVAPWWSFSHIAVIRAQ